MADVAADASALVDLLLANDVGRAVRRRIAGQGLHAPSHVDAEILSALGRSHRAGDLSADEVETKLGALATAPIHRHPANELMLGAWARRHQLRLADALYVELAVSRGGQPVVPCHGARGGLARRPTAAPVGSVRSRAAISRASAKSPRRQPVSCYPPHHPASSMPASSNARCAAKAPASPATVVTSSTWLEHAVSTSSISDPPGS
ncbi:MAG: type II toxin-antitoxin system VapC family toxin [Actinomycetota bacterium]|nr:type II toxin-antitoxin system VapC family toxin [Actinomycetota bacterium]